MHDDDSDGGDDGKSEPALKRKKSVLWDTVQEGKTAQLHLQGMCVGPHKTTYPAHEPNKG